MVAAVIIIWGLVDVILGVVWLATNGRYKAIKVEKATHEAAAAQ